MAPGDTMQGRRRDDGTDVDQLEPGDYCRRGTMWWVCLPNGVIGRIDDRWTVVEHDDGTASAGSEGKFMMSVSPSIHDAPDGWHGWLERGVWWEA
jgi:hypothetical protein